MPAAALVVHQARYTLGYGMRANSELAAQGHSYLHSVVPWTIFALGVAATSFLRRHARTVTRVGGAVLVVVGLLLRTGGWTDLVEWLRSWLATTGLGESSI